MRRPQRSIVIRAQSAQRFNSIDGRSDHDRDRIGYQPFPMPINLRYEARRLIEEGTHLGYWRGGTYAQYCELQFEDVQKLDGTVAVASNEALQMIKRLINAEFSRKIVHGLPLNTSVSSAYRVGGGVGETVPDGLLEKVNLSSSHSGTAA